MCRARYTGRDVTKYRYVILLLFPKSLVHTENAPITTTRDIALARRGIGPPTMNASLDGGRVELQDDVMWNVSGE